jgi:hypothetical protein
MIFLRPITYLISSNDLSIINFYTYRLLTNITQQGKTLLKFTSYRDISNNNYNNTEFEENNVDIITSTNNDKSEQILTQNEGNEAPICKIKTK